MNFSGGNSSLAYPRSAGSKHSSKEEDNVRRKRTARAIKRKLERHGPALPRKPALRRSPRLKTRQSIVIIVSLSTRARAPRCRETWFRAISLGYGDVEPMIYEPLADRLASTRFVYVVGRPVESDSTTTIGCQWSRIRIAGRTVARRKRFDDDNRLSNGPSAE